MTKKYQTTEFDTSALAVPEQVSGAMDEIAADMREGLLALAVGAGLQVMAQLMEADVSSACGPRGKHDPGRTATRHGAERGSVTLGGRRVPVTRPRVRATGGTGELPVPSYDLFNSTELLGKMAMGKMLAGLSTRRYGVGLEPVGEAVDETARSTSRSAVSRKFVAMTEHALGDLLGKDLSDLDLVALMIDGVHFADHLCVVALGWEVTNWLKANARTLGIEYLIWQGRIWSVARDAEGWRPYDGGGMHGPNDVTGGHYDHAHWTSANEKPLPPRQRQIRSPGGPTIAEGVKGQ